MAFPSRALQRSGALVGNAIATPHAMLGLINTIAQTSKVSWQTTPVHLIDLALTHRLSASRQEVLVNSVIGKIEIKEVAVSPTMPCPTHQQSLQSGMFQWVLVLAAFVFTQSFQLLAF